MDDYLMNFGSGLNPYTNLQFITFLQLQKIFHPIVDGATNVVNERILKLQFRIKHQTATN